VEVIPCDTFRELVKYRIRQKINPAGGIMAIENSIAGSILPNYNLLQKSEPESDRRSVFIHQPEPDGQQRRESFRRHQGSAQPPDGHPPMPRFPGKERMETGGNRRHRT
jgi:hypothetical protein